MNNLSIDSYIYKHLQYVYKLQTVQVGTIKFHIGMITHLGILVNLSCLLSLTGRILSLRPIKVRQIKGNYRFICICVCGYLYFRKYVLTYTCLCFHLYVYMYIYINTYIYIFTCIRILMYVWHHA
jgi:hypothetical protein